MRICIFDSLGTWFAVPTLRCILEEFEARGFEVDMFVRQDAEGLGSFPHLSAQAFPVRSRSPLRHWRSTARNWGKFLKYRGWEGWSRLHLRRYDLSIGVNPDGVIESYRLHRRTGTPYVYLSFEMTFREELKKLEYLQDKEVEIEASRNAALIISQDQWRAALLCEENRLPLSRVVFLPVAPRAGELPRRTDYLRERYGIGQDQTVVLHAGGFGAFTRADELIESLKLWPAGFILVVHSHFRVKALLPYLDKLRSLRLENVRITDGSLSAAEHETMVASADIGLALYRSVANGHPYEGRNVATMGLSSGKLASYARAGIPVVAMGNPHISELMEKYRFGYHAGSASEIGPLLQRIRADRDTHSHGARRFFLEQLDFDRYWPPVWDRMSALCSGSAPLQAPAQTGPRP